MAVAKPDDRVYYFSLRASYQECEKLYYPNNDSVVVVAESGHKVQIPVSRLRAFIDRQGLRGRFRLIVSGHNKIKSFERMR